jgi:hypothetical protein
MTAVIRPNESFITPPIDLWKSTFFNLFNLEVEGFTACLIWLLPFEYFTIWRTKDLASLPCQGSYFFPNFSSSNCFQQRISATNDSNTHCIRITRRIHLPDSLQHNALFFLPQSLAPSVFVLCQWSLQWPFTYLQHWTDERVTHSQFAL